MEKYFKKKKHFHENANKKTKKFLKMQKLKNYEQSKIKETFSIKQEIFKYKIFEKKYETSLRERKYFRENRNNSIK